MLPILFLNLHNLYDPENTNFLTQDTYRGEKDDPESLNLYAYCNNNPISYTDPTGHFPWIVAGIWAYRAYRAYRAVKTVRRTYKAAKTLRKTYKVAKTYRKARTTYRSSRRSYQSYKKARRSYSKPKVTKRVNKTVRRSYKTTRVKKQYRYTTKKKLSKPKVRARKKSRPRKCFTADTLIATSSGLVRIDKIKEGDFVWAENPETGEKELKEVKQIFINETDKLIHLTIGDETIRTTELHPFWVEKKGWIPAGALKEGDRVRLQSGEIKKIDRTDVEILDRTIKVYNFEVEEFHTYYVSGKKVLVHNMCAKKAKKSKEEVDPYARPSQKKQGREKKAKSRRNPEFESRSNKRNIKPPKKHTPSRTHQKKKKKD